MKDLKLDNIGDLVIEDNSLSMVSGIEELKQRIKLTLLINQGEWFLDTNLGVPWLDMFREKASQEEIEQKLIEVISSFDEIEELQSLSFDYDSSSRNLKIDFTAIVGDEEVDFEIEEVV